MLYEGKSKRILSSPDDDLVHVFFKDDVTAFNGVKHDLIKDKGVTNCKISYFFMKLFESYGINTHLVNLIDERTQLCFKADIIPIEVVVRNIAAGSLCRRFGIEKGTKISHKGHRGNKPLVEFFYKSDEHGDPPMSREHALLFDMATNQELNLMISIASKVNNIMIDFWSELDIDLVDFKLEFGRVHGEILLADEMTPDSCRLWKKGTQTSMDKDVYRFDKGDLSETYKLLLNLIETRNKNEYI